MSNVSCYLLKLNQAGEVPVYHCGDWASNAPSYIRIDCISYFHCSRLLTEKAIITSSAPSAFSLNLATYLVYVRYMYIH